MRSCLIVLSCMFLVGCQESGPQHVLMSGKVTFNGEPVEDGTLKLRRVPAAAAAICSEIKSSICVAMIRYSRAC